MIVPLGLLAVSAAVVGPWALLAPESFYRDFPGGGRHWVAVDGPFNEHLLRDVGAAYLAFGVVTVLAAVRPDVVAVRLVGIAWLVFGVPHLAYHAAHRELYGRVDAIANTVSLGGTVLLAAVACVLSYRVASGGADGRAVSGNPTRDQASYGSLR